MRCKSPAFNIVKLPFSTDGLRSGVLVSNARIRHVMKPTHGHRTSVALAGALVLSLSCICSSADETHAIYPPLQIFKEFCLDAGWSLETLARLAEQHHYALISSKDVTTPDGSVAHQSIWQAEASIGPIGIIGIEGISESRGHTVTCTVTAPSDSTDFMQAWLTGSFGDPTSTLNTPQSATEIHWTHTFEDGKVDVSLLMRVPGQNTALLTVMKHKDASKSSLQSD
jgi:hypothetical protein